MIQKNQPLRSIVGLRKQVAAVGQCTFPEFPSHIMSTSYAFSISRVAHVNCDEIFEGLAHFESFDVEMTSVNEVINP